ncbi:transcriptional regulator [Zhengella mangrovi]|uniref:Transcriptional regulator n=1 Tax=Zhengella mangrovi TaxID=1982044 RepID=A0A2G1QPS1_9HYPH|nr:helix-turn-helix domain-containing protein [Zhengella mangrovi]PHP67464.1 transcriptional regulator [Zhengella mangrovi]
MTSDEERDGIERGGGLQSLDAALRVLITMVRHDGPIGVSDLARECAMPASKAHRYLASFLHAGLVRQAGRSGKYDLGPGAIRLGLAALNRHDFVNAAADDLAGLTRETGMTAMLSVWGDHGPTVVRWERAATLVAASLGLGTTLPLLTSATGRVFLAWLPRAVTATLLAREMDAVDAAGGRPLDFPMTGEGISGLVGRVRAAGGATVDSRYIPGLVAAAAPILDWQGEAQAVITLIGTAPAAIRPGSPVLARLHGVCRDLSLDR